MGGGRGSALITKYWASGGRFKEASKTKRKNPPSKSKTTRKSLKASGCGRNKNRREPNRKREIVQGEQKKEERGKRNWPENQGALPRLPGKGPAELLKSTSKKAFGRGKGETKTRRERHR